MRSIKQRIDALSQPQLASEIRTAVDPQVHVGFVFWVLW